ncbi:MAG TPA: TrkA C-terminal domain-containing protein [Oscillospiraceae bacterium]|nr:TrkA C-terminal domain-containing protein [Oscillospiraceae bacterium]
MDTRSEHLERKDFARYEQIALIIARDITRGVYLEGEKISGRTTLASKYSISPETVRKALALLSAKQVVDVIPNSGTIILSRAAAQLFADDFKEHNALATMERRLTALSKERDQLNLEIERLVKEIVGFKDSMLKNMHNAEEITVGPNSPLIGESVQTAQLRTVTGATVTAIKHHGRWQISPGADIKLAEGDILLVLGSHQSIKYLRKLAAGSKHQA